ncbi:MAG: DUF1700 domain-containing protein [Ruminococcaceae bacterium]|nr:DUF1700 domain-containing protein [Oscillospiraceae bacterium]
MKKMTKNEFLDALRKNLKGLPESELEERLNFYSEIIDDRMEEGLSEDEAVAAAGNVDEITAQIFKDVPFIKIAKEKIKPKRRLTGWEIALLTIGSPLWISLLVSALAGIFSVYVSLWAVIISLWSVFVSFIVSGVAVCIAGTVFAIFTNNAAGLFMIGSGLVLAGLSVFVFFGCKAATKGLIILTKKTALAVKKCFIKKEAAE